MKAMIAPAGLLVLIASAPAAAAAAPGDGPACSRAAVVAAGASVRAARAELMSIPLGEDETLVPPETGVRIERLKDRIRAFVSAQMACAPAAPDLDLLGRAMAADGDSFVETAPYDPARAPPDRHGNALYYQVGRIASHGRMLAVVATVGIKCGSDAMLMLYGPRDGGGWKELMVRRSEPYREVKGGWQDLRFAVSPADSGGDWFVATVSTTPWCSSAWQGMPYEIARPGKAPDRPRVFLRGRNGIYLGNESDLSLEAGPDSVEIRHDGASLDPAILIRRHVRRYAVAGETARRVQPVAESVRDFVDEWIVSPWAEARMWSASDPGLARIHDRLREGRYELLGEFGSIRACGNGVTQVEIGNERGPGWYFLASGGESGPWTLERVGRRPDARCAGPDRLKREGD